MAKDRLMCSFKMHESMITNRPARRARSAASEWITPSCIHTPRAPMRIADSTIAGTNSDLPENVYNVHTLRDIFEARIALLAENFGFVRIHSE